MFPKEKLDRINELAHIAKTRELTSSELSERAALRSEYLEDFRSRFRQQLDNIEIVEPDDPRLAGKTSAISDDKK